MILKLRGGTKPPRNTLINPTNYVVSQINPKNCESIREGLFELFSYWFYKFPFIPSVAFAESANNAVFVIEQSFRKGRKLLENCVKWIIIFVLAAKFCA